VVWETENGRGRRVEDGGEVLSHCLMGCGMWLWRGKLGIKDNIIESPQRTLET
jgi:hypothetical protein